MTTIVASGGARVTVVAQNGKWPTSHQILIDPGDD
jgi:hypothetical protein